MQRFFSFLTLMMLIYPLAAKLMHGIEELNETHCRKTDTHFCANAHVCELCEFVFLHPSSPQKKSEINIVFELQSIPFCVPVIAKQFISLFQVLTLRGPPIY
jgi:hypothetical protein